ncbi:MAG: archease [Candidatus Thermoplasmatota archaeon]|jgi:SHS2 domain-containing protein|nr:archease [Candidatus Thermoplasmatota archaeon]
MCPVYKPDMGSFEFGDHTADIWISARGNSAQEVLSRMVAGLYGTISEAYVLEEDIGPVDLSFTSTSNEELLVLMLTEVLFLLDSASDIVLLPEFVLLDDPSNPKKEMSMRGKMYKVSIVPEKQGMEVKAVTRHGTSFETTDGAWKARVLLDI